MRPIKLRAWYQGRIWDVWRVEWSNGEITAASMSIYPRNEYWFLSSGEPIEFIQYTGLKDKNGKEIYELDIVNWCFDDGNIKCDVRFTNARFYLSPIDIDYGTHHDFVVGGSFEYEVIGNIYENPELLNE